MLDHLVGLLLRAINAQVTGAKPVQVQTELGSGNSESDLVRAIRQSTQQAGARAGDQLVSRNLDVQPTIRVRPGWPVRIVVHKDIVLRQWGGEHG